MCRLFERPCKVLLRFGSKGCVLVLVYGLLEDETGKVRLVPVPHTQQGRCIRNTSQAKCMHVKVG